MIINHNISALNTHRQLGANNNAASGNLEKLSSGLKINRAGDDAAGLAISEKMRGQIRGLDMAAKNAQDGISLIQTAEGALNETHDILQRMRELAVQGGNDTNTTSDRERIQEELNSLTSEINRIGNTTEFNTQKLLNGAKDSATVAQAASPEIAGTPGVNTLTFAAGATAGDTITIDGVELTFGATTADADATAAAVKSLIDNNAELSAKYSTSVTSAAVELTQKAGYESPTLPTTNLGTVANTTPGIATTPAQEEIEAGAGLQFQIGANENQSMTLEIADMRASALGITGTAGTAGFTADNSVNNGTDSTATEAALDVSTHANAASAVTTIQTAIDNVSAERSKLGATQNRLDHTINNLGASSENLTAAESRIRDVDMAAEMMEFTKNNILTQAAQAMLAQANQQPQGVLQLLR